jgi:hypothetical protein
MLGRADAGRRSACPAVALPNIASTIWIERDAETGARVTGGAEREGPTDRLGSVTK